MFGEGGNEIRYIVMERESLESGPSADLQIHLVFLDTQENYMQTFGLGWGHQVGSNQ